MAKWEVVVSSLIGAATIGVGIWQYHVDSQMRSHNAQLEARKPFLEKQMELCFDASEAASILATSTDSQKWQRAKEKFWVLYWGPLSIVERPLAEEEIGPVESQMKQFGDSLKLLQEKPELPLNKLEGASFHLAHACRDLMFNSWKIEVATK